jgi:cytochrome c oxidase subunit 2
MRIALIAKDASDYNKWYDEQLKPAKEPQGQEAQHGKAVFLSKPCVMCHNVQGTLASGRVAPDLTHIASRRGIAANTLPMTRGALAAWIADPQAIKPGAHMPRAALTGDELNQLVAYLEQLQ